MSKFQSKAKIQIAKRIFLSLFFIACVFIFPWWFTIILGLLLCFYLENFYEFILAGIILDSLYGGIIIVEGFSFIFTLIFTILTFFLINFKKKLLIT